MTNQPTPPLEPVQVEASFSPECSSEDHISCEGALEAVERVVLVCMCACHGEEVVAA